MLQHCPSSIPNYSPAPSESYYGSICLIMHSQFAGTVTLRSLNLSVASIIDPNFLSHPFDRRALIEGIREVMRIQSAPIYASRTIKTLGPGDDSDEAIWEHIKTTLKSSWHMSCTVCMDRGGNSAVVDSSFKVFGVERLRVVHLSVCPFVMNAHVQSTAYVLGELGAEVLAEEYGLGDVSILGKIKAMSQGNL